MTYCLYVTYTRTDLFEGDYASALTELHHRQDEAGERHGAYGAPCPLGAMSFEGAMAERASVQGNTRARAWLKVNPDA